MCGIAGIYFQNKNRTVEKNILNQMISTLDHRGPDDRGYYIYNNIGLGHSRLSIIDLKSGQQPIYNEDKSIVIVFNGEIYNYPELTKDLKKRNHHFYTKSDTEVIVHAYEEWGTDCFKHFNGQFAIALWDNRKQQLLLARDRVGIRPLFYSALNNRKLVFASEIKAIFCHPEIVPKIDIAGINQIFTLWVNIPPQTVFQNIQELSPGHFLLASSRGIKISCYWKPQYPYLHDYDNKPIIYYQEKLEELLLDSVSIRLRADVPVASYLSGGIDSSIISAIVKKYHNNELKTFSVTFSDTDFDERKYQTEMVDYLGTDHRIVEATYDNIGKSFSDVVWFAEKPLIRTAPAPLYLLSKLVNENNIKVVLTGEGADEVFGGYNIFKEDKIRRFLAKFPESNFRSLLLSRLYPYINKNSSSAQNFWQLFFKKNLADIENPYYSHMIRWNNTSQIKKFLTGDLQSQLKQREQIFEDLDQFVDPEIVKWHPFSRAQYLEMQLFMPGYLLSSQGDRMMMGHSVEGRFPFLDHRIIEFANTIPPEFKMKVLNEKYILKKTFGHLLPDSIIHRNKQPYRAPIYQCLKKNNNSIAEHILKENVINEYGYFDSNTVKRLIKKTEKSEEIQLSAREDMAVVGIISLQLLHHHYIANKTQKSQVS